MPDHVTAYPLCWPPGHARRPAGQRRSGSFSSHGKPVSVAIARKRLQDELDRIGARDIILSTNVELRLDGRPRSGSEPGDPAVALYFQIKGQQPVAMPCDTYTEVAQNIAALAAHIEATRRIARYGVASIEAMFTGFMAIRGPGPKPWREVLGFFPIDRPTRNDIEARRRELAKQHHPDAGGNETMMAEINAAFDAALREIGA